jgi:3-hydroxyisobutyrate dehydrogenase-like beta-hydroxyacid dehydrogenase
MAGEKKSLRVAFIGLGVMGYPMAGHLVRAGFATRVYNRTSARAEAWAAEFGGQVCQTPALAAHDADVVLMCVGNDQDVRSVAFGDDGTLAGLKSNAIGGSPTAWQSSLQNSSAQR